MSFRRISKRGVCMLALAVSILVLAACAKPRVKVSPPAIEVKVGETEIVTATVSGKYSQEKVTVEFATDDAAVATVDPPSAETNDDGEAKSYVRGVSPGSTRVTATAKGKSGSADVTVVPDGEVRVVVTLSPPDIAIDIGDTETVTAKVTKNDTAQAGVTVAFATGNPAVANVSPDSAVTNAAGEVPTTVTGVSEGSTKVTATAEGKSDSADVTVRDGPRPPTVVDVDPDNGRRGQTLNVDINGTDFQDAASSNFGDDITVSTDFVSSTRLRANISIAAAADLGSRTVTVTNPDGQSGSRANAFDVKVVEVPPDTHTVRMDNFAFIPNALTISAGDIVIWRHDQGNTPHTVTSGNPGAGNAGNMFESRSIFPAPTDMRGGDTFSHTFNGSGTFPYHCRIHGGGGMTGIVTVN